MTGRRLCIWMFLFLLAGLFGCSSTLTYLGPLKSKLVTGDRAPGPFAKYEYKYYVNNNDTLRFVKTSMCHEKAEKLRVMKKQRRGVYLAVLELPLFGLGLFDMLQSYAIVQNSKRVEPLAKFSTGNLVMCGGPAPAANEAFVVQDPVRNIRLIIGTDDSGRLFLDRILPKGSLMILKLYPQSDPSAVMTYEYDAK
ncbi:MAG: hypothetical protein GXP53_10705 [Deltaproteobacteria bacterium]|nr:hypothetical protein [Deltaproteobacteria bacterium]